MDVRIVKMLAAALSHEPHIGCCPSIVVMAAPAAARFLRHEAACV
jgi:hypothetical protein